MLADLGNLLQSSSSQWPSCNCYVAMNPTSFINTFWLVEWIKVYQVTGGQTVDSSPGPNQELANLNEFVVQGDVRERAFQ